ncbi:MAG: hypothetical protein NZ811_03995 [Gammaproteobacteria bacterium]|nr:hypothetical protein [Gammaproteobacteria bacterium]
MGVLNNCTITSVTVVGSNDLATSSMIISPDEGYTITAEDIVIEGINYTSNSSSLVYTDGAYGVEFPRVENGAGTIIDTVTLSSEGDGTVKVEVDLDDGYAITTNTTLKIDVAGSATAIEYYGEVRPAIRDIADRFLAGTTVTITPYGGNTIETYTGANDLDIHYFNSEIPIDTWSKIATIIVATSGDYSFNAAPILVPYQANTVALSEFNLIQTSVTEDAITGQITEYVFDLMFKNSYTTGFTWVQTPLGSSPPYDPYWLDQGVVDPDITAVLWVDTFEMDIKDYDLEVTGIDLGGGSEESPGGSNVIPNDGLGKFGETIDTYIYGDPGAEVTVEVLDNSNDTTLLDEVGLGFQDDPNNPGTSIPIVQKIDDTGKLKVELDFSDYSNNSASVSTFDLIVKGVDKTAVLRQMKKSPGATDDFTEYSGADTSVVKNRYYQYPENASITVTVSGSSNNSNAEDTDWVIINGASNTNIISAWYVNGEGSNDAGSRIGGEGKITGTPLSYNTKAVNFNIIMQSFEENGNYCRITGDILFERIGSENVIADLDFNDFFTHDVATKSFTLIDPTPYVKLNTTNGYGAEYEVVNLEAFVFGT